MVLNLSCALARFFEVLSYMILLILRKMTEEKLKLIMIAPYWPPLAKDEILRNYISQIVKILPPLGSYQHFITSKSIN